MNMKPREGAGSFINSGRVSLASQLSIRNISATSGESSKSETSFSPVNDFNRTSSNDISSNTSEDLKDSIHLSKKDSFDNFSSYNRGLTTVSMKKEDDLYMQEETIINSLAPMQLLLVLDHINGIPEGSKCATDIKIFITRFLDRCKQIKVIFYFALYKYLFNFKIFNYLYYLFFRISKDVDFFYGIIRFEKYYWI